MKIKYTGEAKEEKVWIDTTLYVFNKDNDYTVDVPDTREDYTDEISPEITWFLAPALKGLFVEVKDTVKRAAEKTVKKVAKKTGKRKAKK